MSNLSKKKRININNRYAVYFLITILSFAKAFVFDVSELSYLLGSKTKAHKLLAGSSTL